MARCDVIVCNALVLDHTQFTRRLLGGSGMWPPARSVRTIVPASASVSFKSLRLSPRALPAKTSPQPPRRYPCPRRVGLGRQCVLRSSSYVMRASDHADNYPVVVDPFFLPPSDPNRASRSSRVRGAIPECAQSFSETLVALSVFAPYDSSAAPHSPPGVSRRSDRYPSTNPGVATAIPNTQQTPGGCVSTSISAALVR